jgi:hypothetical protein
MAIADSQVALAEHLPVEENRRNRVTDKRVTECLEPRYLAHRFRRWGAVKLEALLAGPSAFQRQVVPTGMAVSKGQRAISVH